MAWVILEPAEARMAMGAAASSSHVVTNDQDCRLAVRVVVSDPSGLICVEPAKEFFLPPLGTAPLTVTRKAGTAKLDRVVLLFFGVGPLAPGTATELWASLSAAPQLPPILEVHLPVVPADTRRFALKSAKPKHNIALAFAEKI